MGAPRLDTTRIRLGDLIAAVSGVVLVVALFLTWYTRTSEPEGAGLGGGLSFSYSGWEALGLIDIVLFLAAAAAVATAVLRATDSRLDVPVSPALVTFVLGALGALLVLYRVLDTPSGLLGDVPGLEVDRSAGPFVALVAALGVTLGGWLSWNEEGRTTRGPAARRRTEPVPPE